MTRKIPKRVTRADQLVVGDVIRFTYKKNAFKRETENLKGQRRFFWTPRDPHLGEDAGLINGAEFEAAVRSVNDGQVRALAHGRSNSIGKGFGERSITSLNFTMDMVSNVSIITPAKERYMEKIGDLYFRYTYGRRSFSVYEKDVGGMLIASGGYRISLSVAKSVSGHLRSLMEWKPPEKERDEPERVKRGIIDPKDMFPGDIVDINLLTLEDLQLLSKDDREVISGYHDVTRRIIHGTTEFQKAEVTRSRKCDARSVSVRLFDEAVSMNVPWIGIKKVKRRSRKQLPPQPVPLPKAVEVSLGVGGYGDNYRFRARLVAEGRLAGGAGCKTFNHKECLEILEWLEWFIDWAEMAGEDA